VVRVEVLKHPIGPKDGGVSKNFRQVMRALRYDSESLNQYRTPRLPFTQTISVSAGSSMVRMGRTPVVSNSTFLTKPLRRLFLKRMRSFSGVEGERDIITGRFAF
jgi:hypothetical protein